MKFTSAHFDKSNNNSCPVFNNGILILENGNIVSFNDYLFLPPNLLN
ncbi:hypothetical protein J2X97_001636 [Epilithonimonas hungarica]|nr:hypothetical protein [Epilithonimonas hungarica]